MYQLGAGPVKLGKFELDKIGGRTRHVWICDVAACQTYSDKSANAPCKRNGCDSWSWARAVSESEVILDLIYTTQIRGEYIFEWQSRFSRGYKGFLGLLWHDKWRIDRFWALISRLGVVRSNIFNYQLLPNLTAASKYAKLHLSCFQL